jgi:hypothetical protein
VKIGPRVAIASVIAAALVRAIVAPLRTLSADEAYYLWAARRSTPWPIDDHPPLLGALLAVADRCVPGPVEIRVRSIAVALQLGTALGLARAARAVAPVEDADVAGACAAIVATWGLMPTVGGLIATPDAPLSCALAWLLALLVARPPQGREGRAVCRDVGLASLACAAVLSKAVAIPILVLLALSHLAQRKLRPAIALAVGAAVATPLAWRSFRGQMFHVAGTGPFVSSPRIGAAAALGALVGGQLLLWSPPLLVVGAASLRRRSLVIGDRAVVVALLAVVALSALVTGRAPEPNWTAPALLFVLVSASVMLAARPRLRAWVVAIATIPTVVALGLWCAPIDHGPFARVPHAGNGPPRDAPQYGRASWRCIYGLGCEEIEAISGR